MCQRYHFTHIRETSRCCKHFKGIKSKHKFILNKGIELQMEAKLSFFCKREGSQSKLDSESFYVYWLPIT